MSSSSSPDNAQALWENYDPESQGSIVPGATPDPSDRDFLDFQPVPDKNVPHIWEFQNNDDGRAVCFLSHFGKILRFCPELKLWRIWFEHRWHNDTTGRVPHYAQILARVEATGLPAASEAFLKANPKMPAKDQDKIVGSWASKTTAFGNESSIVAMLSAAMHHPAVVVPHHHWDADPWIVGVKNGILDLKILKHRKGSPNDLVTKSLAVAFEPQATCPIWEKFIAKILPGELGEYLQRVAGYSLTGNTDDGAFYFCHGSGKNGKSIFIESLATLFGNYAGHARADMIEEPRNGASPKHDLANLPGVRFLHSEETTDGARFRTAILKSIATGETMTGEQKYCTPFPFKSVAKLWIGGNHKPGMDGADYGFVRRVRLIPFAVKITDEEEIPRASLLSQLALELPGVLNWLINGLSQWKPGIKFAPKAVQDATNDYEKSEDALQDFINECTQDALPHWEGTTKKIAYDAYFRWAEIQGEKKPLPLKTFTRRLGAKGWKLNPGRRHWMLKSICEEKDWGEPLVPVVVQIFQDEF